MDQHPQNLPFQNLAHFQRFQKTFLFLCEINDLYTVGIHQTTHIGAFPILNLQNPPGFQCLHSLPQRSPADPHHGQQVLLRGKFVPRIQIMFSDIIQNKPYDLGLEGSPLYLINHRALSLKIIFF